jgi:uncharacterized membrane protein
VKNFTGIVRLLVLMVAIMKMPDFWDIAACSLRLLQRNYRSLTLREEHRLRVFENRALRRIFGPKRDEVTGEWRKLHNEELHNLYSSPDIIRQVKSR